MTAFVVRHRAGRHRAGRHSTVPAGRPAAAGRAALPMAGVAAVAGALVLGLTPTLSSAPHLAAAAVHYLRGTNIGNEPTDAQYRSFIGQVLDGTGTLADPPAADDKVDYPASLWPVSKGGLQDPTWDASVAQGVANLGDKQAHGDVIFGMSQGSVVISRYKAQHPDGTGNTFILLENPSRPNGGVMSRFAGLSIPILDITFSGATPDNGDATIDIARQYDGWADFPAHPMNLLATANAILGMAVVHGSTQTQLTAADIEEAQAAGDGSIYHQKHGNTTYYLIRTPRLPLLMPLTGIVPDPVLDAVDPVLREIVERGYDRSDYSRPTTAKLSPGIKPDKPVTAASIETADRTRAEAVAPERKTAPSAAASRSQIAESGSQPPVTASTSPGTSSSTSPRAHSPLTKAPRTNSGAQRRAAAASGSPPANR